MMRQHRHGQGAGRRPHAYRAAATALALTSALTVWSGGSTTVRADSHTAPAAYRLVKVDPCQTDPAMTCDTTLTGAHVPHEVYVLAHPPARPRLAVFFPGTGARPSYYAPVAQTLATAGWYVITLRYVTTIATENACPNATYRTDPDCYRRFRGEAVFGQGVPDPTGRAYDYAGTHVDRANSIMNRLLKLVAYLAAHPAVAGPGWGQFQDRRNGRCLSTDATYGTCALAWPDIALGGHSQGAGVALYLSKFYPVARVALLSGPEDAYPLPGRTIVASWIAEGHFATPATRIYGFTHKDDPFYARQTAAWAALRLPGALTTYAPAQRLGGSHRLVTDLAPGCPLLGTALAAHSATAVVGCVTLPQYATVWRYMFGPPSGT